MPHTYATPGSWAQHAACIGDTAGMALPDARGGGYDRHGLNQIAVAVTRCEGCPVLEECRAWSLSSPDPARGLIAGGYTPSQRQRIRNGLPAGTYHGGRRKVAS
jgi:hypothetical protein